MRAVSITRFGGPEVLELSDRPEPRPGSGQVAIDVTHAAVGLADTLMRRGEFGGEPPIVPGLEVAGTVRELGEGVSHLRIGEPVVTLSRPSAGGYAEVSVADAGVTVSLAGTGIDPALAVAALPNATTALLTLETVAHLARGERVLVHGALGALGGLVAQLARTLDAGEVLGTVRNPADVDRATGFDQVFPATDFTAAGKVDVIVDPVGGTVREASFAALAPLGRLICVGNASGATEVEFGGNRIWLTNAAVLGFNVGGLLAGNPGPGRDAATRALRLLAAGQIDVPTTLLPLSTAADAHRRMERGGLRERLILTP
jgi:NADPH:quinone reductase